MHVSKTNEFLKHILPSSGKHALVVKDKEKGYFKHWTSPTFVDVS